MKASWDYDILLVNPPALTTRPDFGQAGTFFVPKSLKIAAMNPGLLSIASYLSAKGYEVQILDLSLDAAYERLRDSIRQNIPRVMGVSSTSGFDYLEALECVRIVKEESPHTLCIAGGQHIGPLGITALKDCASLDLVVKFEGEWVAAEILRRTQKRETVWNLQGIAYRQGGNLKENGGFSPVINLDEMPLMRYELYPNYQKFTPFAEESRGCHHRCNYCVSNYTNNGRIRVKKAERFNEELEYAISLWGRKPVYAVLASTFGARIQNTLEIARLMKKQDIRWTTEFRVDNRWEDYLQALYEAGLTVLNIGMENASYQILRYMGKTRSPEKYVSRCEELIRVCSRLDKLFLRLNFILYAGETPSTLRENVNFLLRNASGIDAVLYSLLFVIPQTPLHRNFRYFQEHYGSELIQSDYWQKVRVNPCAPSRHFSFEQAASLCTTLEKVFSTEEGWYAAEMYHYSQENQEELRKHLIEGRFTETA